MEWSPRERSPAAKKKGFTKLSNYDNHCFSTAAQQQAIEKNSVTTGKTLSKPTLQKSVSLKSKTNRFEDIEKVVGKLKKH